MAYASDSDLLRAIAGLVGATRVGECSPTRRAAACHGGPERQPDAAVPRYFSEWHYTYRKGFTLAIAAGEYTVLPEA